jgi:hypothetical protein
MPAEKYILTNGKIKDHDGKPIKSGESVISQTLLATITKAVPTDATIDKEKDKAKKEKLKEAKLLKELKITTDDRKAVVKK